METRIRKTFNISLISSFIFVIIGLFLFINPNATISIISYIIGSVLLFFGLVNIYKYFSSKNPINMFSFDLAYGVLLSIAGLFLILDTSIFAKVINVIVGIWIIINSITKFQYGLVLKKVNNKDWTYTALVSLLTLAWGVTLLVNPLKAALTITQIIGIFIIVYAVLDIVDNFIIRKNISDIVNALR